MMVFLLRGTFSSSSPFLLVLLLWAGTNFPNAVLGATSEIVVTASGEMASSSSADSSSILEVPPMVASRDVSGENEDGYDKRSANSKLHLERQIDWIREEGGFVSSKLAVRSVPGSGNSYALFATQDIEESELLLSIPRSCVISTPNDDTCETVELLAQEMLRPDGTSSFDPYISYLKTQPYGQLPSLWSQFAQELLLRIVTDYYDDQDNEWRQVLPPHGLLDADWIGCTTFEDSTPLVERKAAMLVHQRGWDELLIPVYDMMSHRNHGQDGLGLNTRESWSVHDTKKPVQVEASRFIRAGEQLYTSYSSCWDCSGRAKNYGTSEILRDYGFVETFPQKWVFRRPELVVNIDYRNKTEVNHGDDQQPLQVTFLSELPDEHAHNFFEEQLERLILLGESPDFASNHRQIPEHEWNTTLKYLDALVNALQLIVQATEEQLELCIRNETKTKGHCPISDRTRYNPLTEMFDDEGYNEYVCDIDWTFPEYDPLESDASLYQELTFVKNPVNQDVCFELDSVWQICGSYRPHYHEMATHYAAQFLPEIKRVLWVGGGDSMLLHEVLKYSDSLELAIGLELDQMVTRTSFKHFGSQPHWDNDKVQWWYGDAAKSLLMLPKEYFGTFDLVLVDLSETVMSHLVTEGLDIIGALSFLLKEEGVFVKNEIYLEKLNKIFKYTMQLHVYDFPVLCSQAFILGSNKIDFLNQEVTDHGVDSLVFKPRHEIDNRFHEVHDYVMNPYPLKHCKNETQQQKLKNPIAQEASPGILMILEAENAKERLQPSMHVSQLVMTALSNIGLSVVRTLSSPSHDESVSNEEIWATVVMREGYVTVRTWPQHAYCAFDIYMWSSFSQLESVKQALVAAVKSESQSSSSFRIVAGGMFGVDTWKADSWSRGPKFETCQTLNDTKEVQQQEVHPMHDDLVTKIVNQNLDLLLDVNIIAALICGAEQCDLDLRTLSENEAVREVVVFQTCPSIAEDYEDNGHLKYVCELEVLSALEALANDGEEIGALILDPSATLAMAQIFHKIASKRKNRNVYFSEDLLVLAPMVDLDETWRRVFLDKFREIYRDDPVFRSQVMFNRTVLGVEESMEMGSFLSGDYGFIEHLQSATYELQQKVDSLVGETRVVESGVFRKVDDPQPSFVSLSSHYNQSGPLQQWTSQKPVGQQAVLQLELVNKKTRDSLSSLSKETIRKRLDDTLTSMNLTTILGPQEFMDLGDGCAIFSVWKGGNVAILWDGRDNITINLFFYEENDAFLVQFAKEFQKSAPKLKVSLQDDMPRGYGRVVNFASDIEFFHGTNPHWAMDVK